MTAINTYGSLVEKHEHWSVINGIEFVAGKNYLNQLIKVITHNRIIYPKEGLFKFHQAINDYK